MTHSIRIENLTVGYGAGSLVLNHLDLKLMGPSVTTIVGASGAGKSTLFRCLVGTLQPQDGTIYFGDQQVVSPSHTDYAALRQESAIIWQDGGLVDRLPAIVNVLCGDLNRQNPFMATLRRFDSQSMDRAWELLEHFHLGDKWRRPVRELSGGERQRVAICRAFFRDAPVVLADEPVASLDPELAEQVMEELVHLATSQDKLLILTLHQLALARTCSHRIIGLKDGSLAFDLASQDFDSKAIEELYTRPTSNKFFPGAKDRLSQPGMPETNPVPSPPQIHRWPNWSPIQLGLGLLALGGVSYAIQATEVSPSAFVRGVPQVFDFLSRLFPPEFEMEAQEWSWAGDRTVHLPRALRITWETILMAVVGTLGGIFLASPISILAARNTSPHPIIYWCSRFILNANRAIPDIIYALVMVAAVGLGPFAGVLALTLASMGSIAKVFAEVIESVAHRPVESLRVTGASWWMVFRYAILPQSLPVMASYGLLYFEHNLRSATILGLVGAGGVGFLINEYYQMFQYSKLSSAILLIILAVTIVDRVSDAIRKKLL